MRTKIDTFTGDYRFLSNFDKSFIAYEGIEYRTIEHAFQAAKSPLTEVRREVARMATPAAAKRKGRSLSLRKDWEEVKERVMLDLLRLKFEDSELRYALVSTDPLPLIEGNYWHDQYWGDCTCYQHRNTPGENRLGVLLMQVRAEIMKRDYDQ